MMRTMASAQARPRLLASPVRLDILAALGFAAVAVALGALVGHGHLHRLDQYGLSHLSPWLEPQPEHRSHLRALAPETRHSLGGTLVALSVYPASFLVSAAIVLAAAAALARRGRGVIGFALVVAWVAANAFELAGKVLVTKPVLQQTSWGWHGLLPGFNHSLPSGHAMRAFVVAAAVSALWRGGRVAFLWALAVPFALVAVGDHTITDVIAGTAAGLALAAAVHAARGGGGREPAPSRRRAS